MKLGDICLARTSGLLTHVYSAPDLLFTVHVDFEQPRQLGHGSNVTEGIHLYVYFL